MAEIGIIPLNSTWPAHTVANNSNDANQSRNQSQHKTKDNEKQSSDKAKHESKKKPPGSTMNSHIDEYA